MPDTTFNDNDPEDIDIVGTADAHGQAALLLVESLIHSLLAKSIISPRDALEIVQVAADSQLAIVQDAPEPSTSARRAAAMLHRIIATLSIDLPPSLVDA